MILLIDVGNTHTVFGTTNDGKTFKKWRFSTGKYETEDELFSHILPLMEKEKISPRDIGNIIVCSVVPSLNHIMQRFAEKYFEKKPIWVEAEDGVIRWNVKAPCEIGADRVANVIGAYHEYGSSCVILDFGTAITIDLLLEGTYEGGVIMPGLLTMVHALFTGTAKLPLVDLKPPIETIGKDTGSNIQIGVIKGSAHAVNGLIEDIKREYGKNIPVVITGGQSKVIAKYVIHDVHDGDLTLKGMFWFMKMKGGKRACPESY